MNRALPIPQPARNPTMPPMPSDMPARKANTTMIARPATRVFFAPSRLDTQPVISMATAAAEHPQQIHLDLEVDDLDAGEAAVVALGARKHEVQPGETFRVFLDPAGHPFCLVLP